MLSHPSRAVARRGSSDPLRGGPLGRPPRAVRRFLPAGLLTALIGLGLLGADGAVAAERPATPGTLGSVFAAAAPGDTVRLAAGDYGTFSGGTKAGTVTLAPQAGATATMAVNLNGAQNLRFDGLTIRGATVLGSRDIAFANSRFTGMSHVKPKVANANILFDRSTFDGINACSTCYEGRITVNGTDQPSGKAGVVISNSHFSGGDADGVQLIGGADGVQVGPGNEFTGLKQISAVHTDPIQLYGADNTVITGNYIHDSSTGIMAPDGTDGPVTITNNTFARIVEQAIYLGHKPSPRVEHNTIAGRVTINDEPGKSGPATSGAVFKNNVLTGGLSLVNLRSGAIAQQDYNLTSGGSGSHDVRAAAQFTGGSNPSALDGFRLVAGSPGTKAADDGTDMGAFGFTVGGGTAPTPPTTPTTPPVTPKPPVTPVTPKPPVTTPPPATGGGTAPANPTVALLRPTAGSTFGSRLALQATAADDSGIARVEFWVNGARVEVDARAPYERTWTRTRGARFGAHTVTARAIAKDGQVASQSVTVRRVRGGGGAASSTKKHASWRVTATPGQRGTVLTGAGVARHRVVVRLARCGDHRGRTVKRVHLRAKRGGEIKQALVHRKRLCVTRIIR